MPTTRDGLTLADELAALLKPGRYAGDEDVLRRAVEALRAAERARDWAASHGAVPAASAFEDGWACACRRMVRYMDERPSAATEE